jgi:hypothetical protein
VTPHEASQGAVHVARMLPDVAPEGGFGWNELGSIESKSSRLDAGSAISLLIHASA